jgi:hypothetical protein
VTPSDIGHSAPFAQSSLAAGHRRVSNRTAMTDDELWDLFQRAGLPAAVWTHTEHLRVAWMYLRRCSIDEAHVRMRVGIIRLNASHGLVETIARGYHETMTRTWLRLVASAMRATPEVAGSREFLALHPERLARDAWLRHYTRERMMSPEARAVFVPPDLAPIE